MSSKADSICPLGFPKRSGKLITVVCIKAEPMDTKISKTGGCSRDDSDSPTDDDMLSAKSAFLDQTLTIFLNLINHEKKLEPNFSFYPMTFDDKGYPKADWDCHDPLEGSSKGLTDFTEADIVVTQDEERERTIFSFPSKSDFDPARLARYEAEQAGAKASREG